MPVLIPRWAIGKHITTVNLLPQSLSVGASSLQLISATSYALFGHLREIGIKFNFTMEEISSMDRRPMNYIITQQGHQVDMTEIEKQVGDNLVAKMSFGAYDYVQFSVVRGGQTFSGYGALGDYGMSSNKSSVDATLSIMPIDVLATDAPITYS